MPKPWIQRRLDGGCLHHFHITADFRWPVGWRANVYIAQEGAESSEAILVATCTEATTPELEKFLRQALELLVTLD